MSRISIAEVDPRFKLDEDSLFILSFLKTHTRSYPYQIADHLAEKRGITDEKRRNYFRKVYIPKKMEAMNEKGFLTVEKQRSEHKSHIDANYYSLKSDLFLTRDGYFLIIFPYGVQICHSCDRCPLNCEYKPFFQDALKKLREGMSKNEQGC